LNKRLFYKLDRMAALTDRTRGSVMRCLIELADAAPERDLLVRLSVPAAVEHASEAVDVSA
jgi:hypothetical protein